MEGTMMATFDVSSEVTIVHPEDPDVSLTLRWTERALLGPTGDTRDALVAVLETFAPRRPPG
jgi:hypothetical protein